MSLIKSASKSTELSKSTNGHMELDWGNKAHKHPQIFDMFRELFENLNDDSVKKFTITIGGKSFSINKDDFYSHYKVLREKVETTVNKYYEKSTESAGQPTESKG
jgi:hypothetical protein